MTRGRADLNQVLHRLGLVFIFSAEDKVETLTEYKNVFVWSFYAFVLICVLSLHRAIVHTVLIQR